MARVPTWTELRMDATRLNLLQKECYLGVHKLLDLDIPELDRKILSLYDSKGRMHVPAATRSPDVILQNFADAPNVVSVRNTWDPENISVRNSKSLESVQARNFKYPEVVSNNKARSPEVVTVTNVRNRKEDPLVKNIKKPEFRSTRNKKCPQVVPLVEPNIDELVHLKPLPLPLSYYFRRNRPELVMRANGRLMYLKNKTERRKQLASTRIINSLEQIRLSSRGSNNQLSKQTRKDSMAPKYQVQCRLSEHEMKRLTARTYQRLPEVKRRRREEFSNHMKVQNYKNKLEYGRKLLENRRHGIINYPLRSSCDERSITSSQSDFSLNENGRAADPFRSDPYY